MTKDEIFDAVRQAILEVLPDLPAKEISIEKSLVELGANSVDRMEVVMMSMEALGLKIPLMRFAGVGNLAGLVDVLFNSQD